MKNQKLIVKREEDEVIDICEFNGQVSFNWFSKEEDFFLKIDPSTALYLSEVIKQKAEQILEKQKVSDE